MGEELTSEDPSEVGKYRLVRVLGRGGMAEVFLGLSAGRYVAVKVVRAALARDPEFRERFRREVAAARKVDSFFTAQVVDADVECPRPWLATAYVAGPSLAEKVAADGPLAADAVLELAKGLASGLQAIHGAGVIHRDLKPSNVLLADDGPRVIDFGIARAFEAGALTHTGQVSGSPGFMSPEQAEGREVGWASDVFSFGAVLAFAATGTGPFGSGMTPALLYRVVHSPPDIGSLPVELRSFIDRCLAKDPGKRPAPAQILAELEASQTAAGRPAASASTALRPITPPAGVLAGPATITSVRPSPIHSAAGHPGKPPGTGQSSQSPPAQASRSQAPRPRRIWPLIGALLAGGALATAGTFAGLRLTSHTPGETQSALGPPTPRGVVQPLGQAASSPPPSAPLNPAYSAASQQCPASVVAHLPAAAASYGLIGAYSSLRFNVTLCSLPTGQIYYYGVDRHDPAQQIALTANYENGDYLARNKSYTYEVTSNRLIIEKGGNLLLSEQLIRVQ